MWHLILFSVCCLFVEYISTTMTDDLKISLYIILGQHNHLIEQTSRLMCLFSMNVLLSPAHTHSHRLHLQNTFLHDLFHSLLIITSLLFMVVFFLLSFNSISNGKT